MSDDKQFNEERIQKRVQSLLDASVGELDQATRDELAKRRRAVLLQTQKRETSLRWLVPAGGIAAVAMTVWLVVAQPWIKPTIGSLPPSVEELELLSSSEDMEFYRDIELIEWIDDENSES